MRLLIFFLVNFCCCILQAQQVSNHEIDRVENWIDNGEFDKSQKFLDSILIVFKNDNLNTIKVNSILIHQYVKQGKYKEAVDLANHSLKMSEKTSDPLDDAYANYTNARLFEFYDFNGKLNFYCDNALKIVSGVVGEKYLQSKLYYLQTRGDSGGNRLDDKHKLLLNKALELAAEVNSPYQKVLISKVILSYERSKFNHSNDFISIQREILSTLQKSTTSDVSSRSKIEMLSMLIGLQYEDLKMNRNHDETLKLKNETQNLIKVWANENSKILNSSPYYQKYLAEKAEFEGQLNEALTYYLKGEQLVAKDPNLANEHIYFSQKLATLYELTGHKSEAFDYQNQLVQLKNGRQSKSLMDKEGLLNAYFKIETKNQEINALESENNFFSKAVYVISAIVVLAIIALVFLFYMLRSKQNIGKQDVRLAETNEQQSRLLLQLEKEENERLKLQQEFLKLKKEKVKREALLSSIRLENNSKLLDDIKEKTENDEVLSQLINASTEGRHQEANLKERTETINTNLNKLLESVATKKLTKLDYKYAGFLYLNLDNQEIANLLNVDLNTVRVTKYRLKQKLGLDKEEDLSLFIQNLNKTI